MSFNIEFSIIKKKIKIRIEDFFLFLMMRIEEFIFNDKDAMKSFLLTLFFFLFLYLFPLLYSGDECMHVHPFIKTRRGAKKIYF